MREGGFSQNGLFLMELIFAILFFSISGAICLRMFAYASQTARDAENLSYATLAARSAADCYQATGGDLPQVAQWLSGTATEEDTICVDYDDQWQTTTDAPQYQLMLVDEGRFGAITVVEVGDLDPIYTLIVASAGGDTP